MTSRILFQGGTGIPTSPLPNSAAQAGVWESPVLACGLWEHTAGVSADVEVHEVFVVLSGRARIEIDGQDDLVIGPGDVVELQAGAVTRWHVEEPLRKFWVTG